MQYKNIAIMGAGFISWGGGRDFLRLCVNGLLAQGQNSQYNIYILVPEAKTSHKIKNFFRSVKRLLSGMVKGQIPPYSNPYEIERQAVLDTFGNINGNVKIIFYQNSRDKLISILKEIKADVIMPSMSALGAGFPFPWVGYIDDFQYKYWPQFFSRRHIEMRNRNVKQMLDQAQAVIVNSEAVRSDIGLFYPNTEARIFALPFAPVPVIKWFEEPDQDILKKYSVMGRYFIISNQFWVHKSHITAFKALELLNQMIEEKITIVCTGNTYDHRFPHYFDELQQKIKEIGIAEQIKFLGHIPKLDQIQLMKQAIAVLQPTLFEGGPGGGAIYDAVALGVPAIVSDIPVNREIVGEDICFFTAESFIDMAEKMLSVINRAEIRTISKAQLILKSERRIEQLGQTLIDAMELVMHKKIQSHYNKLE